MTRPAGSGAGVAYARSGMFTRSPGTASGGESIMAHELPPPAQMVLLLGGFRVSQALYAAAALGVADHLVAGPASAEHLAGRAGAHPPSLRSEEHTSELQSRRDLVCRLLLEKKKKKK